MHIFISYARADTRNLAIELTRQLSQLENVTVWMDTTLKSGRSWAAQIQAEIRKSDVVIVLISKDVSRDPDGEKGVSFVINEIEYAQRLRKFLIPVVVDKADTPIQIVSLQYLEYESSQSHSPLLNEIVLQLEELVSSKATALPSTADKQAVKPSALPPAADKKPVKPSADSDKKPPGCRSLIDEMLKNIGGTLGTAIGAVILLVVAVVILIVLPTSISDRIKELFPNNVQTVVALPTRTPASTDAPPTPTPGNTSTLTPFTPTTAAINRTASPVVAPTNPPFTPTDSPTITPADQPSPSSTPVEFLYLSITASDYSDAYGQANDAYTISLNSITHAEYVAFLNARPRPTSSRSVVDDEEIIDTDDADFQLEVSGNQWVVTSGVENQSMIEVTWYGARDYCVSIGGRLPTVSEWNKAKPNISISNLREWVTDQSGKQALLISSAVVEAEVSADFSDKSVTFRCVK